MIPDNGELTPEQGYPVIATAREYLAEFSITRKALASAIGTNEGYVSTLFSEENSGSLWTDKSALPRRRRDRLIRDINRWMEEDFRSRTTRRPDNFVMIRPAELIVAAARRIKAAGTIGVVDGPAGVGKTLTAEHIVTSVLPGTMLVTVDHDCRSASGLLRKIYAACRLRRRVIQRPQLADVVERLRGSGRLLIVDQAHDLRNEGGFLLMMNLHDACELPIMLLGTRAVHDRLTDDTDPEFGQLSSRIGLRVHLLHELLRTGKGGRRLQWVSVAELRRIFERGKLRVHSDVWKALSQTANFETGFLRRVKWLLSYAEAIARGAKSELVTLAHLEGAIEIVEGERRQVVVPAEIQPAEATA